MAIKTLSQAYEKVARSLREFGYPDATADMIRDAHQAMKAGEAIPHGIVGRFAWRYLEEADGALDRLDP